MAQPRLPQNSTPAKRPNAAGTLQQQELDLLGHPRAEHDDHRRRHPLRRHEQGRATHAPTHSRTRGDARPAISPPSALQ
eukprot:7141089-Prymnesium_polylepis.1